MIGQIAQGGAYAACLADAVIERERWLPLLAPTF
jgi:hypothetical protein